MTTYYWIAVFLSLVILAVLLGSVRRGNSSIAQRQWDDLERRKRGSLGHPEEQQRGQEMGR